MTLDRCEVYTKKSDFHWWMVGKYNFIATVLDRHLRSEAPGPSVADLGCGGGFPARVYAEASTVIGVDLRHTPLLRSMQKGMKFGVQAEINFLPFRKGTLDRIFMIDVIEHVRDDLGAVAEAGRVLKPEGILVVVVPAGPSLLDSHDKLYGHFRRYQRSDVASLGKKAGLNEVIIGYWGVPLFPVLWLIRKLRSKVAPGRDFDDFFDVPPWANRLFITYLGLEAKLAGRFNFPFGISIMAVFRRPQDAGEGE